MCFLSISGRYLYTIYIISDSYIGFDQQYDIQFEVINDEKRDDSIANTKLI